MLKSFSAKIFQTKYLYVKDNLARFSVLSSRFEKKMKKKLFSNPSLPDRSCHWTKNLKNGKTGV